MIQQRWPRELARTEREQHGQETREALDRLAISGSLWQASREPAAALRESNLLAGISFLAALFGIACALLAVAAVFAPEALVR